MKNVILIMTVHALIIVGIIFLGVTILELLDRKVPQKPRLKREIFGAEIKDKE